MYIFSVYIKVNIEVYTKRCFSAIFRLEDWSQAWNRQSPLDVDLRVHFHIYVFLVTLNSFGWLWNVLFVVFNYHPYIHTNLTKTLTSICFHIFLLVWILKVNKLNEICEGREYSWMTASVQSKQVMLYGCWPRRKQLDWNTIPTSREYACKNVRSLDSKTR